jgi:hypothetical protein
MLVTAPTIGRLVVRPRKWAQRRMAAGAFGPVTRRGRAKLVELAAVEAHARVKFTDAQIALAIAGSRSDGFFNCDEQEAQWPRP